MELAAGTDRTSSALFMRMPVPGRTMRAEQSQQRLRQRHHVAVAVDRKSRGGRGRARRHAQAQNDPSAVRMARA